MLNEMNTVRQTNDYQFQNGGPPSGLLPLDEDIAVIHKAMDVFFNNKFDEVTSSTEP